MTKYTGLRNIQAALIDFSGALQMREACRAAGLEAVRGAPVSQPKFRGA